MTHATIAAVVHCAARASEACPGSGAAAATVAGFSKQKREPFARLPSPSPSATHRRHHRPLLSRSELCEQACKTHQLPASSPLFRRGVVMALWLMPSLREAAGSWASALSCLQGLARRGSSCAAEAAVRPPACVSEKRDRTQRRNQLLGCCRYPRPPPHFPPLPPPPAGRQRWCAAAASAWRAYSAPACRCA